MYSSTQTRADISQGLVAQPALELAKAHGLLAGETAHLLAEAYLKVQRNYLSSMYI